MYLVVLVNIYICMYSKEMVKVKEMFKVCLYMVYYMKGGCV